MFTLSFVDFSDFALFTSFTRLLCLQPTKISVLFPPKTTQNKHKYVGVQSLPFLNIRVEQRGT